MGYHLISNYLKQSDVCTYEPERFRRYCASVHAHPAEHGILVDNRNGLAILAGLQSALLGGGSRSCNDQWLAKACGAIIAGVIHQTIP